MYATKLPVNDLRRISTALFSRLFLSENGRVVTNGKHPRALPESPEKLRLSRAHCKVKILVHENFTELNLEKAGLLINKMGNKIVYNTPLVNAMQITIQYTNKDYYQEEGGGGPAPESLSLVVPLVRRNF